MKAFIWGFFDILVFQTVDNLRFVWGQTNRFLLQKEVWKGRETEREGERVRERERDMHALKG